MPRKNSERMVIISLHVPKQMLNDIEDLVKKGLYPHRSEVFREALRQYLARYSNGAQNI